MCRNRYPDSGDWLQVKVEMKFTLATFILFLRNYLDVVHKLINFAPSFGKKWKKYGKLSYSSLITRISIQKKSQKTPQKEIKRAETIKKEYFKSKEAE